MGKEIKINENRVDELIAHTNENYFVGKMFEDLANEIARNNSIDVKIAKIILAMNTIDSYRWIFLSTTRIIFYCSNRSADVYNISDRRLTRYENGLKVEDVEIEDHLRWSDYRNEVIR